LAKIATGCGLIGLVTAIGWFLGAIVNGWWRKQSNDMMTNYFWYSRYISLINLNRLNGGIILRVWLFNFKKRYPAFGTPIVVNHTFV
jgi:hypothetical protein